MTTTISTKYTVSDKKWDELSDIGVIRDDIELQGQLDKLLRGEKTALMPLQLIVMGQNFSGDATLQLVGPDDDPILEIIQISPLHEKILQEQNQ